MTDKKKVFTETAIRVRAFVRAIKAAEGKEGSWNIPEENDLAENANWILILINHKDWLSFFVNPGMSHQEIIEARRKLAEKVSYAIRNGEAVNIESPVYNGIRRFKAEVMEVYEQCRNESMTMFDVVPELVIQGQAFATNIPKEYKEKLKDVTDDKVRKELMKEHDIAMANALVQFTGVSQYILEINNVKGFDISLFEIGDYVAPAVPTQPEVKGNEMKHNDEAKAILEAINLVAANTNKSLEEMRRLHADVMAEHNRIGAMCHPFSIPQSGMLYQQANGAFERPQPQPQQPRDGFGQPRAWPTNPVEPIPVDLGQFFQKAQGFSPVQAAQNAFNVQPNATYTSPDFIGAGFDSPPVGKVFTTQGEVPTGRPNSFSNIHQGQIDTPWAPPLTPNEIPSSTTECFMACIKDTKVIKTNGVVEKSLEIDELANLIENYFAKSVSMSFLQLIRTVGGTMKKYGFDMFMRGISDDVIYAFLLTNASEQADVQKVGKHDSFGMWAPNASRRKVISDSKRKTDDLLIVLSRFNDLVKQSNSLVPNKNSFNIVQACYAATLCDDDALHAYLTHDSNRFL